MRNINNTNIFNNRLSLFFMGVILFALSACSSSGDENKGISEMGAVNTAASTIVDTNSDELIDSSTPQDSADGNSSEASSSEDTTAIASSPTRTPAPIDLNAHPIVPEVSQHAIDIYQQGIAMGNDPKRFSKVGDCQNISTYFLAMFEKDSRYFTLGEYGYLQDTINWYRGSFSRESLAVNGGLNVARVLSPFHADAQYCEPNENSLECEIRLYNPSITIVSLEENWGGKTAEDYENFLRTIIDTLISKGVLPILATKADNYEGDNSINLTIIKLAVEYELPLWNFWLAVQPLPNHGLREDGFYLTLGDPHFDRPENMQASWPWRNLTALQVLDAVRIAVTR
ncbi:MAG: hypothetical protein N2D54_01675 [Chloroflexota bacterium]